MTVSILDHFTLRQHRFGIVYGNGEIEYLYNIYMEEYVQNGSCSRLVVIPMCTHLHFLYVLSYALQIHSTIVGTYSELF